MRLAEVLDLVRGTPRHPLGNDAGMALSDHLRELRSRVIAAALFIVTAFIVALFFLGVCWMRWPRPTTRASRCSTAMSTPS